MSHGPSTKWKEEKSSKPKIKLGLIMFFFYLLVYAGFIFLNVAYPNLMKKDLFSFNVAIIYGWGLIFLAFLEAIVYNFFCNKFERSLDKEPTTIEGGPKK